MLYKQVFKTLANCEKRIAFERAHVRDGSRGNVNFRFFAVRCRNGVPDVLPYDNGTVYNYRIEKTLGDYPTDPRMLVSQEALPNPFVSNAVATSAAFERGWNN